VRRVSCPLRDYPKPLETALYPVGIRKVNAGFVATSLSPKMHSVASGRASFGAEQKGSS
jgi:hypothetical protein